MWRRYLVLAQDCTASHKDGMVKYTVHELRHVCVASGATDMQVTNQMGHRKIETTKNIYGNSQELHQAGEKPQVTGSPEHRSVRPDSSPVTW